MKKDVKIFYNIEKINNKGLVAGIILKNKDYAANIVEGCINKGVLVMDTKRESIKLGPPLTITIDALEEVFDVIEEEIKHELYTQ